MVADDALHINERFTGLSDRFRSMWTFFQFMSGVFKHQGLGEPPLSFDFQGLYRHLQSLVPRMGLPDTTRVERDLDKVDRNLGKIHEELARVEAGFAPSLLRRFFDHLKRQDKKVLFALVKFYLQMEALDQDRMDKLDLLLTRVAEAPLSNGRVLKRDPAELEENFAKLAVFAGVEALPDDEQEALITTARRFSNEMRETRGFDTLLSSQVYDRFRRFKLRLGKSMLSPRLLVAVISTNIEGKNRFRELYQEEEGRILEDTNRIFEIERYLEKNPNFAHPGLRQQIETFRRFRTRYDSGRRDDNIKREDLLELRRAMHQVLEEFDPSQPPQAVPSPAPPPPAGDQPEHDTLPGIEPFHKGLSGESRVGPETVTWEPVEVETEQPWTVHPEIHEPETVHPDPWTMHPEIHEPEIYEPEISEPEMLGPEISEPEMAHPETVDPVQPERALSETASIAEIMPPDPLLNEPLHKIMFALELVVWNRSPDQIHQAEEVHHLRLEPWEIEAYQRLAERRVVEGTIQWDIERFYLSAAALRVRMEEEAEEIIRFEAARDPERLADMLERSAQSLERAREVDRRFQWYIDDMLYRGETASLEQFYRSHFRFLHVYSRLWLDHQASGGLTPF